MNRYWYQQSKRKAHDSVWNTVKSLINQQTSKRLADADYMRLYGANDVERRGFAQLSYKRTAFSNKYKPSYNVVQQCTDTIVSKIGAKQKTKPEFIPSGGDFEIKQRAERLSKFVEGQFYALDLYDLGRTICRDACVWGTGVLKLEQSNGDIIAERVLPMELLVDETEGMYGNPRNLYQTKLVAKEALLDKYPSYKKEIDAAAVVQTDVYAQDLLQDHCEVVEAWHLGVGDKPGRHVICLDNTTLEDEDYKRKTFPFVFLRWVGKLIGFWGQGIAEQLLTIQLDINRLSAKIYDLTQLHGTPWIMAHRNDQIPANHFSNKLGTILRYSLRPPAVQVHQCVSPELYEERERQYRRAFEIVGLSELSATSRKPAGLDAAVAMREMADIESERFFDFGTAYQNFYLDAAKHLVELAREISEEEGDYSVKVIPGKDMGFHSIDWKEVDLTEDEYIMKVYPVNILPSRPEGRLQKVQELMQAGLIDPAEARDLMEMPDLEASYNLESASRKLIQQQVDGILNTGEYVAPEPKANVQYALQYATNKFLYGRMQKYPEEHLDAILQYVDACEAILEELEAAQAPQQPMPPDQGAMPPAGEPIQ